MNHGCHGVWRMRDLELIIVEYEPCPSAAELTDGGVLELLLKVRRTAEIVLDPLGEFAGGRAAALGLHRVPEETMVPGLRRVIEDAGLGLIPGSLPDDCLERLGGKRCPLHQIVQAG